jgi:putative SOS response-associated peptidase YedK
MCGRYTLRRPELLDLGLRHEPQQFEEFSETRLVPRFNIAPSQDVAIVRTNANGDRVLGLVRWGLVPSWSKGLPKVQPINARAETVPTSGMFRSAFKSRRCLIPADGFYEWQKLDAKNKQPMFIHFPDNRPFGFAGLWESWKPSEDESPLLTCTIITTVPNALMSPIHNRMPVIIKPEDYEQWLDPKTEASEAVGLMKPYPDGKLAVKPVSKLVNNPRNDSPDCIKTFEE